MEFKDIPFSDYESRVFISLGAWRNYEELEEFLTLDELILTNDTLSKKEKNDVKLQAMFQGVDVSHWDDDEEQIDLGGEESLPEEMLAAERALKDGGGGILSEQTAMATGDGAVATRYMSPELAAQIAESVKGLG